MKALFTILIFLPSLLWAQKDSVNTFIIGKVLDGGFTNKAEAKNLIVKGKREGKWVQYYMMCQDDPTNDTTAPYYELAIYKQGQPVGMVRGYYRSGKLFYLIPDSINHIVNRPRMMQKKYNEDGTLIFETTYFTKKKGKKMGMTTAYKNGKEKDSYKFKLFSQN